MRIPDKLPDLRGRGLRNFRIVWIIVFLLAVFSIAQSVPGDFLNRQLTENMTALGIARAGPVNISTIRPIDPDGGNDIREGDVLISVDGRPIGSLRESIAALDGPDGAEVVLRLQAPEELEPRPVTVTRNKNAISDFYAGSGLSFDQARTFRLVISIILTSAWVLVALLLYLRRPHDLVAVLISIGALMAMIDLNLIVPAISSAVFNVFAFSGFGLVLVGLLLFPGGKIQPRWSLIGIPLILTFWTLIFTVSAMGLSVFPMQPILVASSMAFILAAMIARFRGSDSQITRQQIKFVLLGIALAITLFVPMMVWFQFQRLGIAEFSPWADLSQDFILGLARISLPGGLLIALLRYRLFDADRVISRSVTYAIMTLLIGIAFFAMERAIDFIGNQLVGGGIGAASFGIAAALAAVLLNPLHTRLIGWSERRFQRKLVSLRDDLPEAARDMRQIASMDELLDQLLERIAPAVHARSASILAADRSQPLALRGEPGTDLVAWAENWQPAPGKNGLDVDREDENYPLRLALALAEGEPVAWLVLGPRIDDSFYNRDERDVVASLADPMARAIATVAQRERREASVNGEIAALREQMTALETTIRSALDRLGPTEPKPT